VFKRQILTLVAALAIASAPLGADVTIVTTLSFEGGGMPGMAGQKAPQMTTHIKGLRSATVVDTGPATITNIIDAANRRVIILNSQDRTAQVFDATSPKAEAMVMPDLDITLKPTGRTRTLRGVEASEHAFEISIRMEEMMGAAQVPPEALAMLAGITMRMNGSIWAATTGPGASEYMAFMKASLSKDMLALMSAMTGLAGGLDQMMSATAQAPGVPYLTEVTMTAEGAGPMVDMMRQMGPMKMKMEVTSISTDPVPDSLFEIPEGYKQVDQKR
jgi:hypothetical protein